MNDGGPAFPYSRSGMFGENKITEGGMSLRDWFASTATDADIHAQMFPNGDGEIIPVSAACSRVEARYRHADAMLAEREVTHL